MIGRTNTGGGGGLSPNSAVLHVTAPVGSTITFSKGGVIAKVLDASKSHVNAEDTSLADWYYAVSSSNYGTWTVTATLNADSASENVAVSANQQYDVALSYRLWLYNAGDMMTAITGGYSALAGTFKNRDSYMSQLSGSANSTFAASVNAVNLGNYTTFVASCHCNASTSSYDRYGVGIGTTRGAFTNFARVPVGTQTSSEVTIDLSNVDKTVNYYIQFSNYSQTNPTIIDYIYLE